MADKMEKKDYERACSEHYFPEQQKRHNQHIDDMLRAILKPIRREELETHCFDIGWLITQRADMVDVKKMHYIADGLYIRLRYKADGKEYEVTIKDIRKGVVKNEV
jgi:hypothetical protein